MKYVVIGFTVVVSVAVNIQPIIMADAAVPCFCSSKVGSCDIFPLSALTHLIRLVLGM